MFVYNDDKLDCIKYRDISHDIQEEQTKTLHPDLSDLNRKPGKNNPEKFVRRIRLNIFIHN